jgi:hypothetical protein
MVGLSSQWVGLDKLSYYFRKRVGTAIAHVMIQFTKTITMSYKEQKPGKDKEEQFPGYPSHPPGEDIYKHEEKVGRIDADEDGLITHTGKLVTENANDETSIAGLDVPGADLDADKEALGQGDEENQYFSLGGENHEGLEEQRSDNALEGGLNPDPDKYE